MISGKMWMVALVLAIAGMVVPACVAQTDGPPNLPTRMRGLAIPLSGIEQADIDAAIERIAAHGANWVRFGIKPDHKRSLEPAPTPEDPLLPYKETLKKLRDSLETCRKYDITATVAVVPWGRNLDFFWNAEKGDQYRDHLPQFWVAFAKAFKDEPNLVAYNLMAEPNFKDGNAASWRDDLLPKCVAAVRSVNKTIWLSVQPGPWGLPVGFETLKPIDDPYVIYSFDAYPPHTYTHQGLKKFPGDQVYPGMLKQFPGSPRILWDREQLKKNFAPAKAFADKYHVRMMCEEFGVLRWAPGRGQWMRDMISVFEENGFDWATFSLVGWNGWNPTFAADAKFDNEEGWWKAAGPLEDSPVLEAWRAGWELNKKADATTRPAK